jgi:hypothetical protein
VAFELTDYKGEACKIKTTGQYTVTVAGKTKTYAKGKVIDLVKEDGQWKVASLEEDDKEVTQ